MEQQKYLMEKRDKIVNPSSYYQPKKYHNLEKNYKNEAYREFDRQ